MEPEDCRLLVYAVFATYGRPPTVEALVAATGEPRARVTAALRGLADERHVVLDAEDRVVMAHPFSAVPMGFAVMGHSGLWWGGCAWDAFALPHLLPCDPDVLVSTRCPACDRALAWVVRRDAPPAGDQLAHFLIPLERMWDDVVRTCANQRLFCDEGCIESWLASTGHSCGYVMDLRQLWLLAQHWYDGRLDRGYMRREPGNAQHHLRSIGLRGPFWDLPPTGG